MRVLVKPFQFVLKGNKEETSISAGKGKSFGCIAHLPERVCVQQKQGVCVCVCVRLFFRGTLF